MSLIKKKTRRDEARKAFARKMNCLILTHGGARLRHQWECNMLTSPQAHHVYNGISGGIGLKPDDFRTVPLCEAAHEEFHRIGKETFEKKYGLDLEAHIQRINKEYDSLYPPQVKKERKTSARVGLGIKNCPECSGEHFYPLHGIEFGVKLIGYMCKTKNKWVELKTVMKTIYAIASGEYSDYRVMAVAESKELAEAWAEALRTDEDGWHDDARVEEMVFVDEPPARQHFVYLNQDLWNDGSEGDLRISESDKYPIDYEEPSPVRPRVRFVRAPVHGGKGGRLEVTGRDKQSVMKVYTEQVAMWRVLPAAFKETE